MKLYKTPILGDTYQVPPTQYCYRFLFSTTACSDRQFVVKTGCTVHRTAGKQITHSHPTPPSPSSETKPPPGHSGTNTDKTEFWSQKKNYNKQPQKNRVRRPRPFDNMSSVYNTEVCAGVSLSQLQSVRNKRYSFTVVRLL